VTSVASSHQRSIPGTPRVTARLHPNATLIARAMSVIIPGRRSVSSSMAPLTKTQPPYANTSVPNSTGMRREAVGPPHASYPSQCWIIGAHTMVGIDSSSVPQNLRRNISTL